MILITGGTGLLGSHLLIELTKKNEDIRALYRSKSRQSIVQHLFQFYYEDKWEDYFNKIQWVKGDILDITELNEAMKDSHIVYHCAALVSFHPKDFDQVMKINREGTANVVNLCLSNKVDKLCYVSSTAAIGGEDDKIIDETHSWKNTPTTSGYSISKYSAEKEVWRGIEEGLNAVMVNPCVILGPGNWNDSSLTLCKTMEKGVRFYPPGANAIVDARDVARIMVQLTDSSISAERYLCIGNNQSFQELMTVIAKELKVKTPKTPVKRWMVNSVRRIFDFASFFTRKKYSVTKETVNSLFSNYAYSADKIKNELNYEFYSLEETVKNAINGRVKEKMKS